MASRSPAAGRPNLIGMLGLLGARLLDTVDANSTWPTLCQECANAPPGEILAVPTAAAGAPPQAREQREQPKSSRVGHGRPGILTFYVLEPYIGVQYSTRLPARSAAPP